MTLPIEHLSYSSISSYMTCGKAWKYRYIDKVQAPTSPTLIIGSTVHDTVEEIIRSRTLGTYGVDSAEFATKRLSERLLTADLPVDGPEAENAKNDVLRFFTNPYILSELYNITAKVDDAGPMIERKVTLEVPEVEIPIIGYIDIILSNGIPADFKTSAKSWTQEKAEAELQPVFYLGAMQQMGIPMNWEFWHIVLVKTKQPKFQILKHHHWKAEVDRLMEQVQTVWKSINAGIFMPAAPGSWKCSSKWCEYYDLCHGSNHG